MTTWENCEFKKLLISRKLLEIELNRCHFRRLCFFEVFGAEIHFFGLKFFLASTRISQQILTTWEKGEFKELLISRKLLEIELYRFHFRRLWFFELFVAEIYFFDPYFVFAQIPPHKWDVFFQINMNLRGGFDDRRKRWI